MEKLKKKKLSNKWLFTFLALFMFISSIFTSFFIVGYSDLTSDVNIPNIQFKSTGGTWTYNNSILEGSINGKDGTCGGSGSSQTARLTIEYIGDSKATLSFNYELSLNSGSCNIDNTNVTSNGLFTKELNQDNSIVITITSGNGSSSITKIFLKNFNKAEEVVVNFNLLSPENGSYTYTDSANNVNIISDTLITTSGNEYFTLNAIPNDGYEFYAWYFNDKIQSTENPYTGTFTVDANIYPKFIIKNSAVFKNNDILFFDLDEAITSAENSSDKTIILVKSGSIQGGESEVLPKIYTLSSGITLLIPCESSYTTYKNEANYTSSYLTPTIYSELIIESFTNIVCLSNSSIYVAATGSSNMGYNGAPSDTYGKIEFLDNTSTITLENGSYLYAYGYITGEGTITCKNGSNVKEFYQFTDWRGGTESLKMLSNSRKVFLFNQYYIQNIECNLRIEYGAIENICTAATMSIVGEKKAEGIFIGKSGSDTSGMFKLQTGAILEKKYNGTEDRLEFTLAEGVADLSSIIINPGVNIDSSDYVLPINSNITLTIKSGASVNVNQDIALLPGSKVVVENGGILNISNNVSIYTYDRNSWVGNGFVFNKVDISPIRYSVYNGKTKIRTTDSLLNSLIDINGTINIGSGAGIYSTRNANSQTELNENVANIISSQGTGKLVYNGTPGNSTTDNNPYATYQYKQETGTYIQIAVSHAVLRNEKIDSNQYTYFDLGTNESALQDIQIVYDNEQNKWVSKNNENTLFNVEFINEKNVGDKNIKMTYENGKQFILPTNNVTNFSYNNFTLKKRYIPELGIYDPGESIIINLGKDIQAYAIWGGWINFNGVYYYIDYNTGEFLNGLKRVDHYSENKTYIMKFDNGIFDIGYTGIYYDSNYNKNYYVASGIVQENLGLIKYTTNITALSFEYIYIQNDNSLLTSGRYYIDTNLNNLLPSGYYSFDSNGYIIRDDTETTNSNGEVYIKDYFTYIDGIKVSYGLFVYNNNLYYSNNNCEIVRNTTFYVSKTNNLGISEGLYYFDEQGRMYDQNFNLIEVN